VRWRREDHCEREREGCIVESGEGEVRREVGDGFDSVERDSKEC